MTIDVIRRNFPEYRTKFQRKSALILENGDTLDSVHHSVG